MSTAIAEGVCLNGRVEKILHQDESSGFCIFVAGGQRGNIGRVLATCPDLREGLKISARGGWESNDTYGAQFRAHTLSIVGGASPELLADYVLEMKIKGVGPKAARRIVDTLGPEALEKLEEDGDLPAIKGVKPEALTALRGELRARKGERAVELTLQQLGIAPKKRALLRKAYRERAADTVEDDPWRPAREIGGFGYQESLRIADRLEIPNDDPRRLRGAFDAVLERAKLEGNCGLPRASALDQAARLAGQPRAKLDAALAEGVAKGIFVDAAIDGVATLSPARLAEQEGEIAGRVRDRLAGEARPEPQVRKLLADAEAGERIALSDAQRDALALLLQGRCGVLTGGPGVGKSTSTRVLVSALEALGETVQLAAPTGRAAKRLEEATGRPAHTVHRTLGANGASFLHGALNPLDCTALVLDEVSMMDVPLTAATLRALAPAAAVYFIGDADQLPSVGPGRVLGDLIASGVVPTARLTEIRRQEARDSRIVALAHAVNAGVVPDLGPQGADSDLFILDCPEREVPATLVDLVVRRLPGYVGCRPEEIQVLTPMRKHAAGTQALNLALRDRLNGRAADTLRIRTGHARVGDKVINVVNDYERGVRNGDIGVVSVFDAEQRQLGVNFPDETGTVGYDRTQGDDLELAYALTVHKSQGGEYPVVVIPLVRGHRHMLRRNLLYTGLTRGKALVVLVGDRSLIAEAAARSDGVRRITRLEGLLRGAVAAQAA